MGFSLNKRRFVKKSRLTRTSRLAVLTLLVALLALAPLAAFADTLPIAEANKILKELDLTSNFTDKDFSALFTIVSEKPGEKQTVTQARVFRRDAKKQFTILIMLPEVNKGQGYLTEGDNLWFYDPSSRKFSHSSIKENLQNTKAKTADFKSSSLSDDYSIAAVTDGKLGNFDVWIFDLSAKNNEVPYDKMKLYVRKDKHMILKQEDYAVNGRLMRTTLIPKYVELDGKLLPSQILIVDEINKGEKSQITMTEQSVDKLPDKVFTKAFLEQVNR